MLGRRHGARAHTSFLVMMTRFTSSDTFKTLRPLYEEGDLEAERLMMAKIKSMTIMSEDLRAEYCRLHILAWETAMHFRELFQQYGCWDEPGEKPRPFERPAHSRPEPTTRPARKKTSTRPASHAHASAPSTSRPHTVAPPIATVPKRKPKRARDD